jgi:hypothetical protein
MNLFRSNYELTINKIIHEGLDRKMSGTHYSRQESVCAKFATLKPISVDTKGRNIH